MRIRLNRRACTLAACCLGSLALETVRAADAELEQVTVTANRLEEEIPQELAKYGTRVDVITSAQIKNGGFVDVAQALETLAPGLFIAPKNGRFDYVHASFQGSTTGDAARYPAGLHSGAD
jgi:outer membrane cobalamin receptor